MKATPESDTIVCKPEGGTEVNTELPINEAIRYGQLIIQKAEEKGESIISDARERAKTILDKARQEAEQRVSETIVEAKNGCQHDITLSVQKNTGMDGEALYAGEVELILPPPIVLANVLKLNNPLSSKERLGKGNMVRAITTMNTYNYLYPLTLLPYFGEGCRCL